MVTLILKMKKYIIFCCFIASLQTTLAQNKEADIMLKELSKASTDSSRVGLMNKILYQTNSLTQQERIDYSKKILDLARKHHDRILESVITAELGYLISINGNNLLGSELAFSGLEIAQQHKNKQALGIIYQDLAICFRNDRTKRKQYLFKALPYSEAAGDYFNLTSTLLTLSKYYSSVQFKDSALYYAQRSYELCLSKNVEVNLPHSLIQLASVHYYDLGNKGIALEYMKKALATKYGRENPGVFVIVNTTLAGLFHDQKMPDSALYYNNKAFDKLGKAPFTSYLNVYGVYKKVYSNINSDSTLKYYKLYETVRDSIEKVSDAQQQQLVSIKKDLEIEKAATQRQQNIQYALIAMGIVTFIAMFFMFSRSIIVTEKWISFFGILGLLIVFEFVNLFIHPFLERITSHTPILMLLALVAVASLLIPLHHRIEKWVKEKMTEKNKVIRLANAKKTIEKLEGNNH